MNRLLLLGVLAVIVAGLGVGAYQKAFGPLDRSPGVEVIGGFGYRQGHDAATVLGRFVSLNEATGLYDLETGFAFELREQPSPREKGAGVLKLHGAASWSAEVSTKFDQALAACDPSFSAEKGQRLSVTVKSREGDIAFDVADHKMIGVYSRCRSDRSGEVIEPALAEKRAITGIQQAHVNYELGGSKELTGEVEDCVWRQLANAGIAISGAARSKAALSSQGFVLLRTATLGQICQSYFPGCGEPDQPPCEAGPDGAPECKWKPAQGGGAQRYAPRPYEAGPRCVECGRAGQYICAEKPCDGDLVSFVASDDEQRCVSCGDLGHPPCGGEHCDPGLSPISDGQQTVCSECGIFGQPPCQSGCQGELIHDRQSRRCTCPERHQVQYTSDAPRCVPCGGRDEPICAAVVNGSGDRCYPPQVDVDSICRCGRDSQHPCTEAPYCDEGLRQEGGRCVRCGTADSRACRQLPHCDEGHTLKAGRCLPCGASRGQPACDGIRCVEPLVVRDGRCCALEWGHRARRPLTLPPARTVLCGKERFAKKAEAQCRKEIAALGADESKVEEIRIDYEDKDCVMQGTYVCLGLVASCG